MKSQISPIDTEPACPVNVGSVSGGLMQRPVDAASAVAATYSSVGRLRKHADYQRAYQATRKQFSPSMAWFLARGEVQADGVPMETGPARVGLTVGKVIGKAHERNRIKRRMRELVRRHYAELPSGYDLILHPRRQVMTIDFRKLESEILRIFRQAAQAAENAAQ